jgi:CrcB protein
MLGQVLAVALGGAAGATARFALQAMIGVSAAPVAVLIANVAGSALAGAALQWTAQIADSAWWAGSGQAFFVTGFCGAFTTMSALTIHTRDIAASSGVASGIGYATINVLLSVCALLAGAWLMR